MSRAKKKPSTLPTKKEERLYDEAQAERRTLDLVRARGREQPQAKAKPEAEEKSAAELVEEYEMKLVLATSMISVVVAALDGDPDRAEAVLVLEHANEILGSIDISTGSPIESAAHAESAEA